MIPPQQAIDERLHIIYGRTPLQGPRYWHPTAVGLDGRITMVDSDCDRETVYWSLEEWNERADRLFKKVGFWEFVNYNDPAAEDIAFCHKNPGAAGRELHRLRSKLDGF